MANLSKQRRERMLDFLQKVRDKNKDDDEALIAINEIENEITEKRYGLVWEEHTENVDEKMVEEIPIFSEDLSSELVTAEDNYNFLLEGDNLHSLHLLEKTRKEQIDVIYIDPPYNTGNGFRYDDKRIEATDSFRHSKWLSFMARRLEIAKRLLKKDGVIFVSINDIEGAQLKMLLDSIFDEKNFVGQIIWESTTQPTNAGSARFQLQKKTESIFCYAKDKASRKGFVLKELGNTFNYPHNGKLGKCRFEIIEKSDAGSYNRESMKFEILGQTPRPGKRWQIGIETARQLEANNRLEIVDGIVKKAVYPEDERDKLSYEPFWSLLLASEVGTAQTGKDELNSILGYPAGFDTVKPIGLMKALLSHFRNDITVLDFFAGSATTGQAVLELNKEDGGNRHFIICTNNEDNICDDVTYPRLYTVIKGVRKNGSEYSKGLAGNLKVYHTGFIPKKTDSLPDDLLKHIDEMIQLEYGVKIDKEKYISILSDTDADELEKNWLNYPDIQGIYKSSKVLLTAKQRDLFNTKHCYTIPDYYFRNELRAEGEI